MKNIQPLTEDEFRQALTASWQLAQGQLFFTADALSEDLQIPESWRQLLASPDTKHLRERLQTLWTPVRRDLEASLTPWLQAVCSVAILQPEIGPPCLLYGMRPHGSPDIWWGLPPQDPADLPAGHAAFWPQLPGDIQRWYGIHAGFQNRYGPFPFFENPASWQWLDELVGHTPDSWAAVELDPKKVLILGTSRGYYFGLWVSEPGSDKANSPALGVLWDSDLDEVRFLDRPLRDLDVEHLAEIFEDLR